MLEQAFAYERTSSAANVNGDSEARQQAAIVGYAASNGIEIVETFYDAAVRGADLIEARDGFARMLSRVEETGIKLVLVEDCSRLARSVLTSELAVMLLVERGVRVKSASGEDLTATDDPARVMMRQVASAFAQYEKARLVLKLRGARQRKRAATGRCEGKRGYDITKPEIVAQAKALAPGKTLRAIAAELSSAGFVTATGCTFSAGQVRRLLRYSDHASAGVSP